MGPSILLRRLTLLLALLVSIEAFVIRINFPSTSGRSTVCLLAVNKKNRFAQTAHQPPGKNDPIDNDRMWRSKKSIEELEARLTARYGTDLQQYTARDMEDDDDDDEQVVGAADGFRARPVKDPWGDKEDAKTKRRSIFSADDDESAPPRLDVSNLIAEQPAGGRGTNQPAPAFFFKPPKAPDAPTVATKVDETTERDKPVRPPRPDVVLPPLLNSDGQPMLLTTAEAERQFQSTLDSETVLTEEPQAVSWSDLGITASILLENLDAMGCRQPLSVQRQALPSILAGDPVVIGTYTGSGKTLAFLVPILERLLHGDSTASSPSVVVVAPGRELASQIASVARQLLIGTELGVLLAIGGTTFKRNLEQIRARKPSLLIGTPGRLAELLVGRPGDKTGRVKTSGLTTVVLDEFDALLQYKAHRDPTRALMHACQKQRVQTILCSATAGDMEASKLAEYVGDDYHVATAEVDDVLVTSGGAHRTRVSKTVLHGVVEVAHRRLALDTLRRILHTDPLPQQILVFVENARKVGIVVDKLADMGIVAAPLHGGRGSEKSDRAEVSQALREGYVGLVVATELAARGLDAPLLTHVINLDLPTDASHYAHRAGRCGRGGRPGVVMNVTTSPAERHVPHKFAAQLGIDMYTVDVRNGKLNVVDPDAALEM